MRHTQRHRRSRWSTMSKLAKGHTPWTYMRLHVRQFIQLCPTCQKMSYNKFAIFTKSFSVATYSPMVRLNIDFVGPTNTDDDSGYILVIIDTFLNGLNSTLARTLQQKLLQSAFFSTSVVTEHRLRYYPIMVVTS